MTIDKYTYIIVALLPLASLMLVFQTNPYHALVIRAILGAIAALVYIVLGGADVALTEALVGTMLAVTLYVIAVRSSLVMRLGIIKDLEGDRDDFADCITSIKKTIDKHHLRLELVEYPDDNLLETALKNKEVHAICTAKNSLAESNGNTTLIDVRQTYNATVRISRLFQILQKELTFPEITLNYISLTDGEEKH